MTRRYVFAVLAAILTLAIPILSPIQTLHAEPLPLPSFSIRGAITQIASPQLYMASHKAHFFDVSRLPVRIPHPVYYVVSAEVVNGILQYQYDLVAAHGTVVTEIEMAISSSDHTQLIEVGVTSAYSPSDAMLARPTTGHSAMQTNTSQPRPESTQFMPLSTSTSGSYLTVWVDAKVREVTEVKDTINFTYDGTYIDSYSGSDYRWWGPGWGEDSHSIGSYYNSNYTDATVWTHDHFGSNVYCPGTYNEIYYTNNHVVGFGSGAVGGNKTTSADGACSFMLSNWSQVAGGA